MKRATLVLMGLAVLLIGTLSANAAPVFVNSSFEAATGVAPGWVEASPFLGGSNNWLAFPGQPASDGVNAYYMGATDTSFASGITQTVSGFTAGASYLLTFDMQAEGGSAQGRPGAFALASLTGADVSTAHFSVIVPGVIGFFADPWVGQSLAFTATSSSVTFTFSGDPIVGSSWEFGLDNFQLTDGHAVPEPCTLAIWSLLGVCGMGAGWRRRKQA